MGIYCSCQAFGSMLSGALAVAIMNTLDGKNGIAGWRWLFIINCIMTICVGLCGFFILPDVPNNPNPRAFWFKKHYARLAMERLDRYGKVAPKKITFDSVKRTTRSWVPYFIIIVYVAGCLASYGIWYFAVFLKALKNPDGSRLWSTSQVNAIPIGGSAVTAASG
ncbi:putative major facilitator superfamily transporter protein [Phaeoacremonium minimum UCRPA7]|uniref:Putative major facilitator superfamily transporter protein n=1 Tax=Phaeoacremonium minimum (strain UCR-PA7) TaxID=1286976 RepID=R8BE05_PHAM7|nr:putative major facilitator superfamily transporter protein [Phaeoacremonium minimum UCRPA7]EON97538.1 putative major facilitator superfamily transporter protein [Phaeoacremonium minimum UCRPA7]